MKPISFVKPKTELLTHLKNGRYKKALELSEKIYSQHTRDIDVVLGYTTSLLECGSPKIALNVIDCAIRDIGKLPELISFRGIAELKLGDYSKSLNEFKTAIDKNKSELATNLYYKSKTLAALGLFDEAEQSLKQALSLTSKKDLIWKDSEEFIYMARELTKGKSKIKQRNVEEYLEIAKEAILKKELWFVFYIVKAIINTEKLDAYYGEARLLEIEALIEQHQNDKATKIAESLKMSMSESKRFNFLYHKLTNKEIDTPQKHLDKPTYGTKDYSLENTIQNNVQKESKAEIVTEESFTYESDERTPAKKRIDFVYYPNDTAEVFSCKAYNFIDGQKADERVYQTEFSINNPLHVGVEVVFNNPFFRIATNVFDCKSVWYVNDILKSENVFELTVYDDWDSVLFTQNYGSKKIDFWDEGQGRVEFYLNDFKICEKWFWLGYEDVIIEEEIPTTNQQAEKEQSNSSSDSLPPSQKSLEELLKELDGFIGLESVKKSVRNFIDYLEFMKERKAKGLKSSDGISINAVFLGNPGTGKTTIARILGSIFKSIGIIEKGHVVEVDRSALVGQYVGETAQKTEKVIEDAMGGVLFIDEAYTLVKKSSSGQDFGQEAIDILLKRMEDKKGEFAVIVAGYPGPMEDFLTSNPGMKSRFTQSFLFEDYTPEELEKILDRLLKSEDYNVNENARKLLKKHFMNEYRTRDETFGNARMVRGLVNDLKMELSKRYLSLSDEEKTAEAMTTIIEDDVKNVVSAESSKQVIIPIDEDKLVESMKALDNLIGLDSVKEDIRDMIKLARYQAEQGADMQSKFSNHVLFLGNPGTGKTTVARIVSNIYSALGILPKGHLLETDRQDLVASHVGETAQKTTEIINKSIGGTLFIDEAYTLIKKDSGSDFGKEAIDTLLKRMEDDRGKFIVIAAGYTNEMKGFIDSNPGIKSRFTKTFSFEDYTPDEMKEIFDILIKSKNLIVNKEVDQKILKYFNEIYRNRDEKFGNARIVRNLVEAATTRQLLRIADIPKDDLTDEQKSLLLVEDIVELNQTKEKKKYEIKGDPEKLKELISELHSLTGLQSVKDNVDKLISGIKIAKLRKERGLQVIDKSLHSVFTGNPGTGKTTVARLMSKIYKELGLLEKGHLVEVDRSELVAGYQGQTAEKTDKIIESAIGGTLFIDEAYTLARGSNDFGQEAIDTILKRMEDYRGQFIVIVAGYTNEMKRFIDSNPGLQSRFSNFFEFEDYTPRQLLTITAEIADSNGYILDEGALQQLLELFSNLYQNRDKNFGNARTARNIFYKAIENQEIRISKAVEQSDEDLTTITFEDFEAISDTIK